MGSNGLMGILQDLMDIMEAFGRTDRNVFLDMRDINGIYWARIKNTMGNSWDVAGCIGNIMGTCTAKTFQDFPWFKTSGFCRKNIRFWFEPRNSKQRVNIKMTGTSIYNLHGWPLAERN